MEKKPADMDRKERSKSEDKEQKMKRDQTVMDSRKERSKSEDKEQQMERGPTDRDRKERSRSEEVEQQANRVVAVSSRFGSSLQDLVHLTRLSRSTSASVQDLRYTVKQQKIRRTNSIQEAIRRATSHTELNISSGPGMDYYTPYRNRGLTWKGGKAYRTYEYQFLSKKQKISLGRRLPVSMFTCPGFWHTLYSGQVLVI